MMNQKYIRQLIRLVEESEIESLEVSSWGRKVKITQRLTSSSNGNSGTVVVGPPAPPPASTTVIPPAVVVEASAAAGPKADTSRFLEIKSPMVGTFYAAPAPDANPYVSLNEKVTVGQVVCIVEAMKLMNEIESEVSGRVAKIMVENAQPVEFGQTLFLIDPEG